MRGIIILLVVVVVLVLVGWITFNREGDRSSINLETQKIREDTGEIMESGAELLRDAEQEVDPEPETSQTE